MLNIENKLIVQMVKISYVFYLAAIGTPASPNNPNLR
jgi:hypothetical protein